MRIGDWVHTCHDMNKITGFIIDKDSQDVTIQVTIPDGYGVIKMPQDEVWTADDTIWLDDIPALIDLSLQLRDREWFEKWLYELSLWKPIGELNFS